MAAPLASSKASDVNEEVLDLFRDGDAVKQEFEWGVAAPGGGVCQVLCARDISHVYSPIVALRYPKDASEDVIGGLVGAGSLPPSFDDPPVVPIDFNVFSLA